MRDHALLRSCWLLKLEVLALEDGSARRVAGFGEEGSGLCWG